MLLSSDGASDTCKCYCFFLVTDIDECLTVTCLNGGTCINEIGGFRCDCPPGFRGDTCGIGITYYFIFENIVFDDTIRLVLVSDTADVFVMLQKFIGSGKGSK